MARASCLGALVVVMAMASTARAEPSLGSAEMRLSYGLAAGGGSGRSSLGATPLVLSLGGSMAIREQPRVSGFAAIVVETFDRTGAGGEAGLMLTPGAHLRLRAGVIGIAAPYTIWGGATGASVCWPVAGVRACGDLSVDVLVGGTDLPSGSALLQVRLGLGAVFDVG